MEAQLRAFAGRSDIQGQLVARPVLVRKAALLGPRVASNSTWAILSLYLVLGLLSNGHWASHSVCLTLTFLDVLQGPWHFLQHRPTWCLFLSVYPQTSLSPTSRCFPAGL